MRIGPRLLALALAPVALASLVGCGGSRPAETPPSAPTPAPSFSGKLTIFAASSLTEAFNEVKAALEAQHVGLSVTYNFAGTPTLRTQLEHGAKADLFAAANEEQMDLAIRAGVVSGAPVVFAENRLVVVTPSDSSAVLTLQDLAKPGVKLVLTLRDVPVGAYARAALARMAGAPEFAGNFAGSALANLVSEETNVRQALAKVVLGEADASIVYATDVTPDASPKLRRIAIPDAFNVLALYPVAVVKDSPHPAAAQAFIAFLRSPAGRAILAKHGFLEAPE